MKSIWSGEFVLVANNGGSSFWQHPTNRVQARMIAQAPDRATFEKIVEASVRAGGATIASTLDAYLVQGRQTDAAVRSAIPHVKPGVPMLVEEPTPLSQKGVWEETDWDTLMSGPAKLWAIVSGVSWPEISRLVADADPDRATCLYSSLDAETRALAPWLVELRPDSDITSAIQRTSSESHSYVAFRSSEPIDKLRAHFRRFTMLQTPDSPDAPVYFRFYDGRVMLDVIEAMSRPFLNRLLAPLIQVIVPVTPFCLLPEGTSLNGEDITPFSKTDTCQGRLLATSIEIDEPSFRPSALKVTHQDFAALTSLMAKRAGIKLARELYEDFGELVSCERCLEIGTNAAEAAAAYGLTSIKQVGVFARCQLLIGTNFIDCYPAARRILTDSSQLAWQKKDRLAMWYSERLLAPETLRNIEKIA